MDEDEGMPQSQESSITAQPKLSVRARLFENRMTVKELAADMKRSELTIYKWVRQGLPKERQRGRLLFNPDEVVRWLQRTK